VLADLAVDFGGFAVVVEEGVGHVGDGGEVPELFCCGALEVVVFDGVGRDLTLWVRASAEDVVECDSGRDRLLHFGSFLALLLLGTLALFLGTVCVVGIQVSSSVFIVVVTILILPFQCTMDESTS